MVDRRTFLAGVAAAGITGVLGGCSGPWPAGLTKISADLAARRTSRALLSLGFSRYRGLEPLNNAVRDAGSVTDAFSPRGFNAMTRCDGGYSETSTALRDFLRRYSGYDVGMLYLAGHAVELAGSNYFFPIDAQPADEKSASNEGFSLDILIEAFEQHFATAVILLDCCRNNPWAASTKSARRSAFLRPGMAAMVGTRRSTIISYSTSPRTLADDGPPGTNSPYASAIVRHAGSTRDAVQFLRRINDDVVRSTEGRQVPWLSTNAGEASVALFG